MISGLRPVFFICILVSKPAPLLMTSFSYINPSQKFPQATDKQIKFAESKWQQSHEWAQCSLLVMQWSELWVSSFFQTYFVLRMWPCLPAQSPLVMHVLWALFFELPRDYMTPYVLIINSVSVKLASVQLCCCLLRTLTSVLFHSYCGRIKWDK